MPKRTDISSILIIGAGPIVIGQACEFDYSGTQAVKTLREEGYRIILVNSNPATIMTDPELADATYIEPITSEFVARIIEKERHKIPEGFALLPTMGGQTALNCAKALAENGTLKKYDVELIGASLEAINKAENRDLFNQAMRRIGLECPKNAIAHSIAEARAALEHVGLPAIIRPSFTMGGAGGGIAYNREEFERIVASGLDASPTTEVLIDESVLGWKEFEMEVVRDRADNCIIVCSIENIDPMGVHTGDSITVAPALTLTDKEYQIMRNASIAVLREIGVDTGGSNVQFAVNPKDGRMVVIEMNPRVSRSSALASKATGFPIAKVAAKLAVGYTLDEIANDVVSGKGGQQSDPAMNPRSGASVREQEANAGGKEKSFMPASFEPTLDYIVTKIPRFAFEKFPGTDPLLTTAMKSVGEAMAMGRSFPESLQKALRSLETGLTGLNEVPHITTKAAARDALSLPSPDRLLVAAQALRLGISLDEICSITHYDPWFIEQIKIITDAEREIVASDKLLVAGKKTTNNQQPAALLLHWKKLGFSDARIAELTGKKPADITRLRHKLGVRPVYKRVDTCAGEFEALTPYMYSTYESPSTQNPESGEQTIETKAFGLLDSRCWTLGTTECESNPTRRKKIIILGGGPNRIGQGIEFDYCCVHASYALRGAGFETIMINCNPETVSTDYDTSDRLYFEPLTAEDVIEIIRKEQENGELIGVVVQFGGQTPLKLAHALEEADIPIIGTSSDSIDLAEDRERFQQLLHKLKLRQPPNAICKSMDDVMRQAEKIGFPVVVRPSYVLGGRAMRIIHDAPTLEQYVDEISRMFGDGPILIDGYLQDAIEVDVDALCDGKDVYVAGIMEHIEEAGIHSGDSACSLPPYSLPASIQNQIREQTEALALALKVIGLMNVQFAVKDGDIYILEVNPRASRTVPFVAKATGVPIAKIASLLMAGASLSDWGLGIRDWNEKDKAKTPIPNPQPLIPPNHVAVKEAVFPFARFPGVDVILGPEMKSTGEAMGLDRDFPRAFSKAVLAGGTRLPASGTVFVSVKESDKIPIEPIVRRLLELKFDVVATRGTAKHLTDQGLMVTPVNKVREGRPHIVDMMKDGKVHLVFNTTEGSRSIADSFSIRQSALLGKIPYSTTITGARAMVLAIEATKKSGGLGVRALQEYFKEQFINPIPLKTF